MLAASYAKINLFLEVIARLPNNYHQVNTVLCSIDLFDSVKYALTKTGSVVLWSNLAELIGDDNLICRVLKYLQEKYTVPEGMDIRLIKRIPVAAGLAGGSSNAATAILAANRLWKLNLSPDEMNDVAARFGSDINFFFIGGTALGENRGEVVTPMPDVSFGHILLVNPGIAISAREAYGAVELPVLGEAKLFDPMNPVATMFNRLEPGIRKLYPAVDKILLDLDRLGATKSMMSGSGSTCFGIFDDEEILAYCQRYFNELGYFTHKCRTLSRSEYEKCFLS